jgi:hypothetical protein
MGFHSKIINTHKKVASDIKVDLTHHKINVLNDRKLHEIKRAFLAACQRSWHRYRRKTDPGFLL